MKTLRCMAYNQDGVFVAVCLDLSLAAQADTLKGAQKALEEQLFDYIHEAVSEPEHANQLLNRKAPWQLWVRYYSIHLRMMFTHRAGKAAVFTEDCPAMA
ncbi:MULTISPECIES: hypothetical protein [Pantoea]|uniref:DUF1902 domain-containing protein n=2 Tax=Pantoea TaxID=53335 RepID=A0A0U3U8H2_9GAMM|nr:MULTISPECIES: hypothetical protein [Pantoea]ALV91567.1 hypothetical protein LK04_05165 [Pantoea vagans]KHJ65735.1 hypothetical protein QU24_22920 [Pantoea rodasii]